MSLKRRAFLRDSAATVAVTVALTIPILAVGVGLMVDYSLASRNRERLDAAADAAALEAVSASGMQKTDDQASAIAKARFIAAAAGIGNVVLQTGQPTVTVTRPDSMSRTVQISYTADSPTTFSGLLGASKLAVSGVVSAASSVSPNIDFYVLLDNSSSMALPATKDGIALMQALTPQQNSPVGCAFACHTRDADFTPPGFSKQTVGNPCKAGTSGDNCKQIDNYQLARNNGITLRMDQVNSGVSALLSTAASLQTQYAIPPTYRFDVESLNGEFTTGMTSVMPLTSDFASQWRTSQSNLKLYTVYGADSGCVAVGSDPCGSYNIMDVYENGSWKRKDTGYMDSKLSDALKSLGAKVPTAGTGASGSTPREIVFLVTDGVEDFADGTDLKIGALGAAGQDACTALKNRDVKVAVLYTTYYPIPGFFAYDSYVAPIVSDIAPTLQKCASPGLFMTAQVGDDLSVALTKLFKLSTASARLTR